MCSIEKAGSGTVLNNGAQYAVTGGGLLPPAAGVPAATAKGDDELSTSAQDIAGGLELVSRMVAEVQATEESATTTAVELGWLGWVTCSSSRQHAQLVRCSECHRTVLQCRFEAHRSACVPQAAPAAGHAAPGAAKAAKASVSAGSVPVEPKAGGAHAKAGAGAGKPGKAGGSKAAAARGSQGTPAPVWPAPPEASAATRVPTKLSKVSFPAEGAAPAPLAVSGSGSGSADGVAAAASAPAGRRCSDSPMMDAYQQVRRARMH